MSAWNRMLILAASLLVSTTLPANTATEYKHCEIAGLAFGSSKDFVGSVEFLGETFVQWAKANGMAIQHIQPGKPNQNAYIERFNRTFGEEVLSQYLFVRLDDVREAAWWWMIEYNEQRPHDALGDLTPAEPRQQVAGSSTFGMSA